MFKQLILGRERAKTMGRILKKALFWGGTAILALVLVMVLMGWWMSKPLPQGIQGPEADALAQRMLAAINHEAWMQTGAVAWDFDGRQQHVWDRKRHLAKVVWGDYEALIDLHKRSGLVREKGELIQGEAAKALLEKAWAHWANDSFWLNPVSKVMDEGTERRLIALEDGSKGLLVSYLQGGVTPGDSYLWLLGDDGKPRAWRMWVGMLPIGGIYTTWEAWAQQATGAWISGKHKLAIGTLEIKQVRCGKTLEDLTNGEDIFTELL